MKSSLQIIAVLAIFLFATLARSETVSLGVGYVDQVYYSLENGLVQQAPNENWDIGFSNGAIDGTIIINGAAGVELYNNPNLTVDDWEDIDTTGMSENWDRWVNSDEFWSIGAFNLGIDAVTSGTGDYGWGAYDPGTHLIVGYSVYVIKLSSGEYKKMFIKYLKSKKYTFIFSDLDGNNEEEREYVKADFASKNFGYYSFATDEFIDREPDGWEWDLLFAEYSTLITMGPTSMFYNVSGVRQNNEISIYEMKGVDVSSFDVPNLEEFSYNITTIGYDWKKLNYSTGTYDIVDSLIYFINTDLGPIYKIVFTGFDNETGDIDFNQTDMLISVGEYNGNINSVFTIYPNIITAGEEFNVIYDAVHTAKNIKLSLYNMSGRIVFENTLNNNFELSGKRVGTQNLSAGLYMVVLNVDGLVTYQKLIIQ